MIRLLRIEFHKLLYSKVFWIILGLYIILLAPIAFWLDSILTTITVNNGEQQPSISSLIMQGYSVFNFPDVWHNMAYLASWFRLLLALLVVIFVTNEFSYRTLRQNIIDGMSKWEIIWAKELVILVISIVAVIVLTMLTLIFGNYQSDTSMFSGSSIVIAYFVTLILYLNFAYFLSIWLKKSGFVLGILFLYTIVIENLISLKLPEYITNFFPMNLIDNMIPNPLLILIGQNADSDLSILNIGVCGLYVALFISLNYWLLKKGHALKQ